MQFAHSQQHRGSATCTAEQPSVASEGWTLKAGEMGVVASTARSGGVTNRRQSNGGSHRRAEGMLARGQIEQEKKLPGGGGRQTWRHLHGRQE